MKSSLSYILVNPHQPPVPSSNSIYIRMYNNRGGDFICIRTPNTNEGSHYHSPRPANSSSTYPFIIPTLPPSPHSPPPRHLPSAHCVKLALRSVPQTLES